MITEGSQSVTAVSRSSRSPMMIAAIMTKILTAFLVPAGF